jgi:hypothetical protein
LAASRAATVVLPDPLMPTTEIRPHQGIIREARPGRTALPARDGMTGPGGAGACY